MIVIGLSVTVPVILSCPLPSLRFLITTFLIQEGAPSVVALLNFLPISHPTILKLSL